jgi:hypothetical protein
MEVPMKRILIPILLLPFLLVPRSYGSDIEVRLEALEKIIQEQQRIIEKQQHEINELKARTGMNKAAKVEESATASAKQKESGGPLKAQVRDLAYPTTPIEQKYSERPKALEVYSFPQSKFVPDISFIVDGSFVGRNVNDETYGKLAVPGLIPSGVSGPNRGFNLNYGEMSLYSPVDPYFDLTATIPFRENGVELEEAFFRTKALPWGFQIKGGKFRSSFGRLNIQHPHVWDFADAPLINRAFFGEDGLVEKGVQVNWLAPTPFYLLFGGEILQGDNTASFGTGAITMQKNGSSFTKDSAQQPNLFLSFVKSSVDIGSLSLLGGLSYAQGQTRQNPTKGTTNQSAYGDTKIFGLDLTAKYFIDAYRYLSWQNEWIFRQMNLNVGTDQAPGDPGQSLSLFGKDLNQSGFYSQLIYRFARRWRIGARYDLFTQNDVYLDNQKQSLPGDLNRISAMLEFKPTEFSTLRLQFNRDHSLFNGENREPVNSVFLQFNMAIGAHRAHAF